MVAVQEKPVLELVEKLRRDLENEVQLREVIERSVKDKIDADISTTRSSLTEDREIECESLQASLEQLREKADGFKIEMQNVTRRLWDAMEMHTHDIRIEDITDRDAAGGSDDPENSGTGTGVPTPLGSAVVTVPPPATLGLTPRLGYEPALASVPKATTGPGDSKSPPTSSKAHMGTLPAPFTMPVNANTLHATLPNPSSVLLSTTPSPRLAGSSAQAQVPKSSSLKTAVPTFVTQVQGQRPALAMVPPAVQSNWHPGAISTSMSLQSSSASHRSRRTPTNVAPTPGIAHQW